MTGVLIYFGIGIFLAIILSILYVLTEEGKYRSRIIEGLGIDDNMDLGLSLFVTIFLWPFEVIIAFFIEIFCLTVLLWGYIGEGIIWLIKKVIK